MLSRHPEIAVPEFPSDPTALHRFIRRLSRLYFPELRITEEDRRKTALYLAEAARRAFAAELSYEDYLKELCLWTDIHEARPEEVQFLFNTYEYDRRIDKIDKVLLKALKEKEERTGERFCLI